MKIIGIYNRLSVPQRPLNAIRLVLQSDTHSRAYENIVPDGDIYIHTGDFTNTGTEKECTDFHDFVAGLPHKHKIVIAGNHDITLDTDYYKSVGRHKFHPRARQDHEKCRSLFTESKDLVYLEDSGTVIDGISIYGSPWQPAFCDWAFNLERGPDIVKKWDLIPHGTDILLTHGPPSGHRSFCPHDVGCADLLEAVLRVKPRLHIFGHVHEGYGISETDDTTFINASTCTGSYRPDNPAIIVDVQKDQ